MYVAGHDATQISRVMGLSSSVILYQLKKMGVRIRPRGSFMSTVNKKELEKMREAYLAGQSMKQISEATGCSCFIVRYQLKKLGIWQGAWGKYGRPSIIHAKANEMKEMYMAGWNMSQIGRVMGLSKGVIWYQLRKMGTRRRSVTALQNKKESERKRSKTNPDAVPEAAGKEIVESDRTCRCRRCGWTWKSRVPIPGRCPKCNSPYWNRDRQKLTMPRARSRLRNGPGGGKRAA